MKQIGTLAAICAALLFISLCIGLMTAGPAIAQGGPEKDVRVINLAAEAIPTTITNVPAVQVNSLPAVQIGNNAGNPVPVEVTNPAASGEPVGFFDVVSLPEGEASSIRNISNEVPEGKRLELYQVTFKIIGGSSSAPPIAALTWGGGPLYLSPDDHFSGVGDSLTQVGTKSVTFHVPEGQTLKMVLEREGPGTAAVMTVTVFARLVDAS